MQPETETVKFSSAEKPKQEPKQLTPIQEWDQVAFALIYQELAPNGFKKIHNGKREVSSKQFLTKQTVKRCQNISAQLIRAYREQLRKMFDDGEAELDVAIKETEAKIKTTPLLNFKERSLRKAMRLRLVNQLAATRHFRLQLDQIAVPRKQKES